MREIILASTSSRRRRLLEQLGISFTCIPSHVEEENPGRGDPGDFVLEMAQKKAKRVALEAENALVIGADTMIYYKGRIIGKPKGEEEAFSTLSSLSGDKHQVWTAFVVINSNTFQQETTIQKNTVYFRSLGEAEIREYILTGEPLDKAGSYAIQGKGAAFVLRIEGCFSGVVGLPLAPLIPALYKLGWKGRMDHG